MGISMVGELAKPQLMHFKFVIVKLEFVIQIPTHRIESNISYSGCQDGIISKCVHGPMVAREIKNTHIFFVRILFVNMITS